MNERLNIIDQLRGIAIVLMILYHFAFDLHFFAGIPVDPLFGIWLVIARTAAVLFILISGISTQFLYQRYPRKQATPKNFVRATTLLFWGTTISLLTFAVNPHMAINFGILHFLGLSTILCIPFTRLKPTTQVICALALLLLSSTLISLLPASNWLLPLGAHAGSYSSWDYFPVLPWFAMTLFGLALGQLLVKHQKTLSQLELPIPQLNTLGRHSLSIYLLHQPVLIGLLLLTLSLVG